jgi:hypothetical protein
MKRLLLSTLLFLGAYTAVASHIIGGYVTSECLGSNQYLLTLGLYEDCGSSFQPSNPQNLTVSSSCTTFMVQATNTVYQFDSTAYCSSLQGQTTCNGGALAGFYYHQWQVVITLPPCTDWEISYSSCCYGGSTNLSGQPSYFFSTELDNSTGNCASQVSPSNYMVPLACLNDTICFNPGFSQSENDSVVYSLHNVWNSSGVPVSYNAGYSGSNPMNGIYVDPNTGVMCMYPTTVGNYVINVQSEEYSNGQLVCTGNYTITAFVMNCAGANNDPQSLGLSNLSGNTSINNNEIDVCAGNTLCFDLEFYDPDTNDTLNLSSSLLNTYPNATLNLSGTNPLIVSVCIPNISYGANVHFDVNDNYCPIPGQGSEIISINLTGETFDLPDAQICWGDSVNYYTPNNATWTVLSGDMNSLACTNCSAQLLTPNQTSNYYVEMQNSCGLTISDTLVLSVYQDSYALGDTVAGQCGDYFVISGTNDIDWIFQNGTYNGDSLPTSTLEQGWNTVLAYHGIAACMSYDTVYVFVDNSALNLSLSDSILCDTATISAIANGNFPAANSFDWTGLGQSTTTNVNSESFFVNQSGWIYVSSYNDYCSNMDSAYVTLDSLWSSTGNIVGSSNVQAMSNETYTYDLGAGLNYTWSVAGGNISSGQGTNTISVNWGTGTSGSVSVQYSNGASCVYDDSISVQISPVNGLDENQVEAISIYPNPVSHELRLNKLEDIQSLRIISSEGRLVTTLLINGDSSSRLDVSDFANGLYHVVDENGELKGRFMVQH